MYCRPIEIFVQQMFDAVLQADPRRLSDVVGKMRKAGVSNAQIAEVYVPLVARRLGEAWVADETDFGAVTIGCARLQGLLHHLSSDWSVADEAYARQSPHYLVGVADGLQHTLGASVLAGQLRHRGCSVHVDLELTPESLVDTVTAERFTGVLLSASSRDHLETVRELLEYYRAHGRKTPVIIGGNILEQVDDILSLLPADLATSDMREALEFCNVNATVMLPSSGVSR